MTTDEAFQKWAHQDKFLNDERCRMQWAINGATTKTFEQDLRWAFCAGWNAALQNLTTKDI